MAEYIEREALMKHISCNGNPDNLPDGYKATPNDVYVFAIATAETFPVADVVEVVHGRWIDTGFFNSYKSPIYECSACHNEVYDHYINCHKFCLHCGARMDGETNGK